MELYANKFESLTNEELNDTNGGGLLAVAAVVTAVATAYYTVYQCGEAAGEFLYNVTH